MVQVTLCYENLGIFLRAKSDFKCWNLLENIFPALEAWSCKDFVRGNVLWWTSILGMAWDPLWGIEWVFESMRSPSSHQFYLAFSLFLSLEKLSLLHSKRARRKKLEQQKLKRQRFYCNRSTVRVGPYWKCFGACLEPISFSALSA